MITCTRPSTLASALNDKSGLIYSGYLQSTSLMTLAKHQDLLARLTLINGKDWRDYKPLYQELEARYGKKEASEGTNIHAVVSAIHAGYDVSQVPEPTRSDGRAVHDFIESKGWRINATEEQVVTRGPVAEPCAGTLDLLLESPEGQLFVGDIKSVATPSEGRHNRLSWSIQVAVYANGQPYQGGEYVRDQYGRPIVDEEKIGHWDLPINTKVGVILEVIRGKAIVTPYWLDLEKGLHYANIAANIRTLRDAANPIIPAPIWGA